MQMFSWTDLTEALPAKREEIDLSEEVMVSLKDGEVSMDRYNHHYGMWIRFNKLVTHWSKKPLPAERSNK